MLKQILYSLVFGAIAVFSYAPFHIWPLAFVSFAGLLWLIANKSKKQALVLGLCWGIGYFSAGIHWIYFSIKQYGELPSFIAVIILGFLVLYLSLFPMLFAFLIRSADRVAKPFTFKQLVLIMPIVWQITEFLRGYILTGFAWLQFGYSQLDSPLRNYFPIVGIDGLNLIFTILCGLLVFSLHKLIKTVQKWHAFGAIIALLVILIAPISLKNIQWTTIDNQRSANFVLVQANIAQSIRWSSEQLNNTLLTYAKLTEDNLDKNKIIIWSEASITDYELNQQPYLQYIDNQARANDSEVAVGIIDYRFSQFGNSPTSEVYNSLIVLGEPKPYQYPSTNRYQKHHLVPFGEFTPLESVLQPLTNMLDIPMSSMQPGGVNQPPLTMKGFKFTTAICYEIILSDLMWQNFTADTDFLLTVSNDAWFGDSIGPKQHLQMAQARALEFGRPLIRSTNNGITAIIDHKGNIIKQLPQFKTDVLIDTISPTTGLTPYAKWGNKLYFLIISLMLISLFIKKRHN